MNNVFIVGFIFGWATIIVLYLFFALISRILYRRVIGLPLMKSKYQKGIPYTLEQEANNAASERRQHIESFLKQYSDRNGFVRREFIEVPPGFGEAKGRFFEGLEAAAIWHTAHLKWQLKDERYLLAERVIDALICLQQSLRQNLFSTVFLSQIQKLGDRKVFRWRVVVETEYPRIILDGLSDIKSWLGVGVDFAMPVRTSPNGKCTLGGDGKLGEVGGIIRTDKGDEFGVSCHHILSLQCASLYWPHPPNRPEYGRYDQGMPDAALLTLKSDCFVRLNSIRREIVCAETDDVNLFIQNEIPVIKWPNSDNRIGTIQHEVQSIPSVNGQIRGPHIMIVPKFSRVLGINWPIWKRPFSVEGQSGSWVIDAGEKIWLGVIVQGAPPPVARTYAIPSYFLIDIFKKALRYDDPLVTMRIVQS